MWMEREREHLDQLGMVSSSNIELTSMTLFLGGRPRFRLNMASMLLVCVMLTGSALAPAAVEDMFHLRVYSCSLKWSSRLNGGSELRITSSQLS